MLDLQRERRALALFEAMLDMEEETRDTWLDSKTAGDTQLRERVSQFVHADTIASLRTSLQADGRWPDVDYASTVATNWPQTTHLTRMRDLARAYAKPGSPLEGDAGLLADALKAYDAWIAEDPSSTNWYHNQINTPQKLGETMVLLEPTPISPPSGPIQWLLQGPPAESNLLAAATRQGR